MKRIQSIEPLSIQTKFLQTQNQHPLKSSYQGLKKFQYDLDVIYQMSSVVELPEKKRKNEVFLKLIYLKLNFMIH